MNHLSFTTLRIFIIACTCMIISYSSISQTTTSNEQFKCGTDELWKQLISEHPEYEQKWQDINVQIEDYRQSGNAERSGDRDELFVTIPVVFHIVYNTGSQNIADGTISSQVQRLNKDFRRLNSDTSGAHQVFKSIAADVEFEFCLASRDPDGNPTTGITRTSTFVTEFQGNDNINLTSLGGKDGWPPEQYLNIWVCNLPSGLGGYTFFPGGPAYRDGVVVAYQTVGGTPFARTCTHEVGHWFALLHTFQDGCSGSSASNCFSEGDRVCDTPQQNGPAFGCNMASNSCIDSPTDNPDMIENYMSYNSCQNMFTQDQAVRMQSV
ncbi:MAG: zinc metalloprotease, partial [Bacteroidetes bacterium]|nr:zinc metalloprotease [Bacteroidota bacterium]